MNQLKLAAVAALALLTLIVVLQNTEPLVIKVLFFSVTAPAALLLFVTTLVGFVVGVTAAYLLLRRRQAL